jgi:ketosteroid isomerase-like protein
MDAWAAFLAGDVTWSPPPGWPEPGPFLGTEAVLRQVRQNRETWDADAADSVSEFLHTGDRVVVRLAWRGRGHGPESNIEATCVYTVRDGLITAFDFFWDHAEALEAVGLSQ